MIYKIVQTCCRNLTVKGLISSFFNNDGREYFKVMTAKVAGVWVIMEHLLSTKIMGPVVKFF